MEKKQTSKNELLTVNGPSGKIPLYIEKFLEASGEESYIKGEKLKLTGFDKKFKELSILGAEVLELTDIDKDGDDFCDTSAKLQINIRCDKSKYNIFTKNGKKQLEKDIRKFLHAKEKKEDDNNYIVEYNMMYNGDNHYIVQVILLESNSSFLNYDVDVSVLESPFYNLFWDKIMNQLITEGVCYSHGTVPVKLRDSLRNSIDEFAKKTCIDYHPNSNDIVRDLVHPALYPYINKVSKLKKSAVKPKVESGDVKSDYWGRPYEKSKFQWLPTPFSISIDGRCSIEEYINNLNRNQFPHLYSDLEKLFELFLPYFEEVWNYICSIKFYQNEDDEEEADMWAELVEHENSNENEEIEDDDDNDADDDEEEDETEENLPSIEKFNLDELITEECKVLDSIVKKEKVLHGRELQVIVKIVDYTLQPGQEYEGVWHAEGMSHENIVMTGIYFLERDSDLDGGDLKFKRAFTNKERYKVLYSVPQERPVVFNQFAYEGFVPLGHFPTEEGYMLVFPNCHIHKIGKLINKASNKTSSRRIIVFFVINPDRKIISTREIAPQQDIISLKQAKEYRLELMAERKYDKEKLNVRDIELCEH